MFVLYFASKVCGWCSFLTLAYSGAAHGRARTRGARRRSDARHAAATVAFFTLPKVYEKHQAECDQLLAAAEAQLRVLLEKLPELPTARAVAPQKKAA